MSPSPEALAVAATMFAAISAYALFAGADFGGGMWDLLAGETRQGAAARALIDQSVTPVWEANHVWLIFVLVILWSSFPPAFAAIMTAMFVPLNLSLLGIFFRGTGFAFRHSARGRRSQQVLGRLFAVSSLITPFFLGTVVGAIVTGGVHAGVTGNALGAWTSPTALLTGGLSVSACAYIGAVYLVADARRRNQASLVSYFGWRAGAAGSIAGLFAAATLAVMSSSAPYVFHHLLGRALPLVAVSAAAGIAALVLIVTRRLRGLRAAAAVAVAAAVWGWGTAQYPWLLPKSLSLPAGSAPAGTLAAELLGIGMFVLLVLPGLVALVWMQQHDLLAESESEEDLRQAVAGHARGGADAAVRVPRMREQIVAAALVTLTAADLLRRLVKQAVSGRR